MSRIDRFCAIFRKRIVDGKTVSRFGERADEALSIVQQKFIADVIANSTSKIDYTDKLTAIVSYYSKSVANLFFLQQLTLEQSGFRMAKECMTKHLRMEGEFPANVTAIVDSVVSVLESELKLLKPVLLDFDLEKYLNSSKERLYVYCTSYPSSPDGQLEVLRQNDRLEKNGVVGPSVALIPRIRKLPSLKLSLAVVTMLRPAGVGNIQGYFNYAAAFFGIPLTFLFGMENNGESDEVP